MLRSDLNFNLKDVATMTKRMQFYFWLAILAHLLLFLSFSLVLVFEPEQQFEKKSDRFLPAYLYKKENAVSHASEPSPPQLAQRAASSTPEENLPTQPRENALALKPALKKADPQHTSRVSPAKAPQTSSYIEAESLKSGKPIDEPLLKELSRATSAKLFYPPQAAAFKIKGKATISFLLYPDGRVAEVTLAQSSGFRVLDEAALKTIKAISPVRDANMYLTKPRYLLAGIIFG